ncbi:MAG: hypothetical protein ACRDQW_06010 [Haloechinothrix sp.]
MTDVVTETTTDLTAPTGCCEPDCGPDTCGPALVAVEFSTKTETDVIPTPRAAANPPAGLTPAIEAER